ncbi:MAG: hypothetical protein KGJ57_04840 [Sphingomonadales bacterium]|nr:hypothetical protein [Sphingomonadales bacterium]MDE2168742.1 hypothetical protein [Sphingomonadales bacterium]
MNENVARTLYRLAMAVEVLALAAWGACWAGFADPMLKVMIGCAPLVLIAVLVSLYMAFARKLWWGLLGVAAALFAYAPIMGLILLGLRH